MTLTAALLSFALLALLITITPGLDNALVLRYAGRQGSGAAFAASAGICAGLFVWALAASLGISALLAASEVAYTALRWIGAAYMVYLGVRMLISAIRGGYGAPGGSSVATVRSRDAFRTGFTVNLLNPKVGAFYVALIPQFMVPSVAPAAMGVLLAVVHIAVCMAWFVVLIALVGVVSGWLQRPSVQRGLDGVVGTALVGFGARLAVAKA